MLRHYERIGLLESRRNSGKYDYNFIKNDDGERMYRLLEEALNYRNRVLHVKDGIYDDFQLDLLLPIKEKS